MSIVCSSIFSKKEWESKSLIETCRKQVYKYSLENISLQEYKTREQKMQQYILVLFRYYLRVFFDIAGD